MPIVTHPACCMDLRLGIKRTIILFQHGKILGVLFPEMKNMGCLWVLKLSTCNVHSQHLLSAAEAVAAHQRGGEAEPREDQRILEGGTPFGEHSVHRDSWCFWNSVILPVSVAFFNYWEYLHVKKLCAPSELLWSCCSFWLWGYNPQPMKWHHDDVKLGKIALSKLSCKRAGWPD